MRHPALSFTMFAALSLTLVGCGTPKLGDQAKNAFTSIKDAMSRSIALSCEYKDTNGQTTVAKIKGNQVRLDSTAPDKTTGNSFHGIIRDNKMWIWADNQTDGMLFDFTKVKSDELKMGDKPIHSQDDVIAKLEEKKDTCKATTVADSEFSLPDKVNFKGL